MTIEPERALRIGWRVWPFVAVAAIATLVVLGTRDDRADGARSSDTPAEPPRRAVVPAASASEPAPRVAPPVVPRVASPVAPVDAPTSEPDVEPTPAVDAAAPAGEPSLEDRTRSLLRGWEARFEQAVERTVDAARDVDVGALAAGGRRLGRLVPFVGPYLRYGEARALYRSGKPGAKERARRRMVLALASLVLDAGSAGSSRAASGSSGVLAALDGAVDLVELSATALAIRDALGDESTVEALAGRALDEVDGLDAVVETLLTLDARDELGDWRAELTDRGHALVEAVEETLRADE